MVKISEKNKKQARLLVDFLSDELDVTINLIFNPPNSESDGQTVCSKDMIIIYQNRNNWRWLREVIVHESAHRYDHLFRGNMHHNPRYDHDEFFEKCYQKVLKKAQNSPYWRGGKNYGRKNEKRNHK